MAAAAPTALTDDYEYEDASDEDSPIEQQVDFAETASKDDEYTPIDERRNNFVEIASKADESRLVGGRSIHSQNNFVKSEADETRPVDGGMNQGQNNFPEKESKVEESGPNDGGSIQSKTNFDETESKTDEYEPVDEGIVRKRVNFAEIDSKDDESELVDEDIVQGPTNFAETESNVDENKPVDENIVQKRTNLAGSESTVPETRPVDADIVQNRVNLAETESKVDVNQPVDEDIVQGQTSFAETESKVHENKPVDGDVIQRRNCGKEPSGETIYTCVPVGREQEEKNDPNEKGIEEVVERVHSLIHSLRDHALGIIKDMDDLEADLCSSRDDAEDDNDENDDNGDDGAIQDSSGCKSNINEKDNFNGAPPTIKLIKPNKQQKQKIVVSEWAAPLKDESSQEQSTLSPEEDQFIAQAQYAIKSWQQQIDECKRLLDSAVAETAKYQNENLYKPLSSAPIQKVVEDNASTARASTLKVDLVTLSPPGLVTIKKNAKSYLKAHGRKMPLRKSAKKHKYTTKEIRAPGR